MLLLDVAEASQLLALIFAMFISILLGMGMPTTAAYAVAASVVAPGLVQLGIEPLTAHFFVFYFAVVSAITPPVALASYAAAGISGANAMETSVASFRIGIAAFIVPFMFFYNGALLMEAGWFDIARALVTALFGVYMLSGGVMGCPAAFGRCRIADDCRRPGIRSGRYCGCSDGVHDAAAAQGSPGSRLSVPGFVSAGRAQHRTCLPSWRLSFKGPGYTLASFNGVAGTGLCPTG